MSTKTMAPGNRGDWYLMANARRIAGRSMAVVSRMTNRHFASELFATGGTSAHQICVDAGIDPDGFEVLHGTQPHSTPDPLTVPVGWAFNAADFSCIAAGRNVKPGNVTLVRDAKQAPYWHAMPELLREADDGPPLYVVGRGMTLDDAMQDAIKKALEARPIKI